MKSILVAVGGLTLGLGVSAEIAQLSPVTVKSAPEGQELVGPYQQPQWSTRGRFSSSTDVYVQPPWALYLDLDYSGTFPKHGGEARHLFTQEIELGLPHHFQVAYENNFEMTDEETEVTVQTIEGRYALADWGKIPLNPTLFAEYLFGIGGEVEEDEAEDEEEESDAPDAIEARLLLGEQIGADWQWALNFFHEWETGGTREWESGFSQALSYSIRGERLKAGIEMQYIRRCEGDSRSDAEHEFDLGPSFTWKPSESVRLDLAPMFGMTSDSPAASVFAVLSIALGRGEADEGEVAPVSTRHR